MHPVHPNSPKLFWLFVVGRQRIQCFHCLLDQFRSFCRRWFRCSWKISSTIGNARTWSGEGQLSGRWWCSWQFAVASLNSCEIQSRYWNGIGECAFFGKEIYVMPIFPSRLSFCSLTWLCMKHSGLGVCVRNFNVDPFGFAFCFGETIFEFFDNCTPRCSALGEVLVIFIFEIPNAWLLFDRLNQLALPRVSIGFAAHFLCSIQLNGLLTWSISLTSQISLLEFAFVIDFETSSLLPHRIHPAMPMLPDRFRPCTLRCRLSLFGEKTQ